MISVWAPASSRVDLEFGAPGELPTREPMVRGDAGWWRWEGDHTAYAAFDYAFLLDGEEPAIPDPRSAWQPHGVDGPSRWFDVSRHEWADTDWRGPRDGAGTLGGVIYELHVGTFTDEGTFDSAVERLDHLVDLGIEVVEVLPVAAIPGRWGWGYDGVDLYAVHDALGGPAGFQRFVDACHARGLGVCLDVVYNHLGPSGNYLGRFGPYFTQSHLTPWGPAVNLDAPGSDEVRAFLVENALRWLRDFHVDALRLDAVHALVDEGERHLLAELSDSIAALADQLGRPLELIAESDLNDTSMVAPTAEGGLGMTAQWADDIHHGLHVALTGETQGYYEDFGGGTRTLPDGGPLDVLAHVLTRGFLHDGSWSTFRDREWGKPVDVDTLDGRRLVTYLQTHDQVGNRATGDRISASLTPGRTAIGAALYLLGPGTPMIFMGEEFAASSPWQFFTDFTDEGMAEAVRAGRRAEFGGHGWAAIDVPDPQSRATRDASVLRWHELSAEPHASLLGWYRELITLRRSVLGASETRFADVNCAVEDDGRRFVMTHRSVVVSADLDRDMVTVSAPGIPDLVFP